MSIEQQSCVEAISIVDTMKLALEDANQTLQKAAVCIEKLGEENAQLRQAIEQAEKDPLKTPLPCDVKVGHVNIKKGVALSVLVARMQVLYDMAQEQAQQIPPSAYSNTHQLEQAQPSRSDIKQSVSVEPVAWRVSPRYEDSDGYFNFTDSKNAAEELQRRGWKITPLYTSPPTQSSQRQSRSDVQPLTDEQIEDITADIHGLPIHVDDYAFARAIEAAHGIRPSDFKEEAT